MKARCVIRATPNQHVITVDIKKKNSTVSLKPPFHAVSTCIHSEGYYSGGYDGVFSAKKGLSRSPVIGEPNESSYDNRDNRGGSPTTNNNHDNRGFATAMHALL